MDRENEPFPYKMVDMTLGYNDADKEFQHVQVCPVCEKDLEIHPFAPLKSCFVHGDYEVKWVIERFKLVWTPAKKWKNLL